MEHWTNTLASLTMYRNRGTKPIMDVGVISCIHYAASSASSLFQYTNIGLCPRFGQKKLQTVNYKALTKSSSAIRLPTPFHFSGILDNHANALLQ